ncbi:tyrosine-type recombinase/integrase [Pseudomonas asiatica]|uniref:tyrosine-type recombinase/integrase n=1 Tax=Pseudomonas asiatica TaxID=2219225 RepID=UPI0025A2FABF|nr:tyrosine-type recombinase/integrase [Pseudomonas asiatica]WJM52456.1 tyrosine-type recombinase/integrase [Pseudomonas asiatica]
MQFSKDILKTLAVFHLDRPEASWEDLKERLKEIAEDALQGHSEDSRGLYMEIYDQMSNHLAEAASLGRFTGSQQRAIGTGQRVLRAAQERLEGRPQELTEIIGELSCSTPLAPSLSLSVLPPASAQEPITFEGLCEMFLKERQGNVSDKTHGTVTSNCRTLSGLLGDLDIRTHTRADMVALKEKVVEGRKPLTINKLLGQLSTVMDWAVNNGLIERSFDKGLKIERGAESDRKPFSRVQIATVMAHANGLPANDWKRWAISLGVLTGLRIGELYQLTQEDVKQVDGITVIDINKDESSGKTLKNDFSIRQVPLVDGAYGFSLAAFLEWVASEPGRLFKQKEHYFNKPLNEALRNPLGLKAGSDLSFHSLRHSISGLMLAAVIPDTIMQAVTGHSGGNITKDLYARTQRLPVGVVHEALVKAFSLVKDHSA